MTEVCSAGFPHSDISGSMDICSSPKLFAAYHVFHRLLVPRHPTCALLRLTNFLCHVASRQLVWVFIKFMVSDVLKPQSLKWGSKTRSHYVLWLPLGNLLGCLSLKYLRKNFLFCMRFSRYMFIWLFYQPSKTKTIFNLRSLVKLLVIPAATCSPVPSPAKYHRPLRS